MEIPFRWLRRLPEPAPRGIQLFAVVGDESYFLPHFLSHYRALGVDRFTLYLDRPTAETLDLLQAQPDVSLLTSDLPFGKPLWRHASGIQYRFHHLLRDRLTDQLFAGRWALTVDADEFVILPERYSTLVEFCAALERCGLVHCSAPMVDFHPECLAGRWFDPTLSPFEGCPWFDPGPYYQWQPPALVPRLLHSGVRERITRQLAEVWPEEWQAIVGRNYPYAPPKCWKVPLIRHGHGVSRVCIHEATQTPPADAGVVLAHFKFYPGIDAKLEQALERREYYRGALEYRILSLAFRRLADVDLLCERSQRWQGPRSLEAAGLLPVGLDAIGRATG